MINTPKVMMCLSLIACSPAAAAGSGPTDIYRCDLPNGRTVYQSAQCPAGLQQKAIDGKNAKRERYRKQDEKRRREARKAGELG